MTGRKLTSSLIYASHDSLPLVHRCRCSCHYLIVARSRLNTSLTQPHPHVTSSLLTSSYTKLTHTDRRKGWQGSRKGWRQASPQDSSRQHPGYHQARNSSSRSSWRCQAYLCQYVLPHLTSPHFTSQHIGTLLTQYTVIYEETRGVLKTFLEGVIRDAVTYTEHAKRKTVTSLDVVYALKRQGRTLYGFVCCTLACYCWQFANEHYRVVRRSFFSCGWV